MPHLLLDTLLDDYNKNKKSGKPALDRISLGKLLWPDRSEENFKSTLSLWASKTSGAIPSLTCAGKICKIIGIDYNTFVKKYVR